MHLLARAAIPLYGKAFQSEETAEFMPGCCKAEETAEHVQEHAEYVPAEQARAEDEAFLAEARMIRISCCSLSNDAGYHRHRFSL